MKNARFATSIHILSLLATNRSQWVSSEWIAQSIGINPVMVRRELAVLTKKGWVESKRGKYGGVRLCVANKAITLADLYQCVGPDKVLGKFNNDTNPHCPIGKKMNHRLSELSQEMDEQINGFLKEKTLENFVSKFE